MPVKPRPAVERVMDRVEKSADDDCWRFTGALTKRGYGVVQLGRGIGTAKVHRVVYEAMVGPIPEGLTLDHLCHTTNCVNPAHLEPVSRGQNTERQWRDGRADPGRHNREKTHCPQGHEYSAENVYFTAAGKRVCKQCAAAKYRRRTPEQRAAINARRRERRALVARAHDVGDV